MVKKIVNPQAEPKDEAQNLLAKVPEEYVFRCHDGSIFRDMKELAQGLVAMSNETFAYHVNPEKNDFSRWVKDTINDEKLANNLSKATSRVEAAGYVATRLASLTGRML